MKFSYVCIDCGKEYPGSGIRYRCESCADDHSGFQAGNLLIRYDEQELASLKRLKHLSPADLFPFPIPTPEVFPVGNTPLAQSGRLSEKYGLKNLRFKLDGANPSGSFKDRASQLVAAQALAEGEHSVVVASTGNAGSSMACAGAAYGLHIILFVPATAPANKLMQAILYGATVIPVDGTYDDAFALSLEYSKKYGGVNRNTAYNPMTIEGKKSVSIELFEQLGRRVPDAVYVPVGDGVIISGVYKGFEDLYLAGITDRIPRIIAAQAVGSNAISAAFSSGKEKPLEKTSTLADSISVGSPAGGRPALRALKKSSGWCVEVDDEAIVQAQLELAKEAGIFVEPAAATSWAALVKDREVLINELGEEAETTVLLTGIGFKDMAVFSGRVTVPESVEPNLDAVTEFLSHAK